MASPIELYLIRHGVAAERGEAWPDDSKRPLVHKGVTRLRRETAGLIALGISFDVVLTSPLTRARQTAELVAEAMTGRPPLHTLESLAPGGAFATFVEELAKYAKRSSRIACVGHEPDLGQLAGRLIGARRPLEFKKGAVCRIDLDGVPLNGPGHLRWFVTPRMLRRCGK